MYCHCNLCVVLLLCILFHEFSWGFFFDLLVLFELRNLFMGVKASLTLGREEKPWVKGLVGLNIEVERFSSWRRFLLFMEYRLH